MTTVLETAPTEAQTTSKDDGLRLKCEECEAYYGASVRPELDGMSCDKCEGWVYLCEECMPALDEAPSRSVWLCEECR